MRITILLNGLMMVFMFTTCHKAGGELEGQWTMKNKHYRAVYEIKRMSGDLKGQILQYSDGTTEYEFNGRHELYLFEKLEKNEDEYYDGVSSATSKLGSETQLTIKPVHGDTLEVTQYLYGRPNTDLWVKKAYDYEAL